MVGMGLPCRKERGILGQGENVCSGEDNYGSHWKNGVGARNGGNRGTTIA